MFSQKLLTLVKKNDLESYKIVQNALISVTANSAKQLSSEMANSKTSTRMKQLETGN